ncbi:MAG: glutathione S-transferase family protein [Spongiibacteraceae bacterium]|nr:glutathione S-transferase family protein [Spongiibacteraceae bacterium]
MLTIHHLRIGRSIFTVWLLEELGIDYALKEYRRDTNMRAGDDLKVIHPLGKSPVIEDEGLVLSESGAITSYLLEKFDKDMTFSPPRTKLKDWARYTQWLHYSEGSVFAPLLIKILLQRDKEPSPLLSAFSQAEITLHLNHLSNQLANNEFILGNKISGADFGISYAIFTAQQLGLLKSHPTLNAYIDRNKTRPAFQAAIARAVE